MAINKRDKNKKVIEKYLEYRGGSEYGVGGLLMSRHVASVGVLFRWSLLLGCLHFAGLP